MDRIPEDLVGTTLGNYRLTARIGAGGMGEVYVAEHRRISRRAALKVLLPELSATPGIVERFLSEARTASLVRHPGIVEIFDCDEDRGRAFIVMELLEGETLAARMRRDVPLSADGRLAAAVAGQIARAVAAAHGSGVVHRDLKPDNVFLLNRVDISDGAVKVVDFGIAKVARPDAASNTQTGAVMGTPIYMSPEQCRGAGRVDHRADIYSLGCMLFEMVCGQPPFIREGAGEYLVAHLSEAPPDPQRLNPGISSAMQALILSMLAKSADARPQTMDAVNQHLMLAANAVTAGGPRTAILPAVAQSAAMVTREFPTGETRRPAGAQPTTGITTAGMNTTLGNSAQEQDVGSPARRSGWLVGGGAVLAVAVVALVIKAAMPAHAPVAAASTSAVEAPAPAKAPAPAPPTAAPLAPAPAPPVLPVPPREIAVTVSHLPPNATLTVDGAPATTPIRVPRRPTEKKPAHAAVPKSASPAARAPTRPNGAPAGSAVKGITDI